MYVYKHVLTRVAAPCMRVRLIAVAIPPPLSLSL